MKTKLQIPFFRITLGQEEKQAILNVIDSGWVVMGQKTEEFEKKFAEYVGAKYAIFVDSCTSALFLALAYYTGGKLNHAQHEDTVFVPSLTFAATAEVVVNQGMRPVFVDVDRETFCINDLPGAGRFGIAVHLTGNKAKTPASIYDSAHRIEKGDVRGSEALWCYSFYATKNMTTVQGGMIAMNNEVAYEWLKKARDHGITQGTEERYVKGSWRYDIDFVGWRKKSDDMHAAIGIEQLKKLPAMNEARNRIVADYNGLLGLHRAGNHLYPILVGNRQDFISFMKERGIQCSVHFLPLHQMTAYKKYYEGQPLPNTDYLGTRLVSIPLYPQMTDEEIEYVADAIKESNLLIHE